MREMKEERESEEVAVAGVATAKDTTFLSSGESGQRDKPKKKIVYSIIKRSFDIVSSGIMLLVLALPIGICLLIKWIEDAKHSAYRLDIREIGEEELKEEKRHKDWIERKDGKIFECKLIPDKTKRAGGKAPIYASVRVGKDGKEFKFHKIRSMCPGAEDMKEQLIEAGLNEADPPAFKMENDPRITKFGKFLRKTSIDELPQLWDIFIGKMSVVGPRPPIPGEVEQYTEEQRRRLSIKGGLLCLWQIQPNRNKLTFDEWLKLDLEYIEKRSIRLDLKIIFKGAFLMIFGGGGEHVIVRFVCIRFALHMQSEVIVYE